MDRDEKLKFQQTIEAYFEDHRIYELFEKLLRELVIVKPKDPIDFLIQRMKKKDTKKIFITGFPGTNRKEISLLLDDELKIKNCICVRDLLEKEISKKSELAKKIDKKMKSFQLVDDDIVIDLLKTELIKCEKENISYIVEGFPKNRIQGMFLQSVGLIPDSLLFFSANRITSEKRLSDKIKINKINLENPNLSIKDHMDIYDLNMKAIRDLYKNFYCELNIEGKGKDILTSEIAKIVKLKNKTSSSRRPPRILLLGPPCSGKYEIAQIIAKKYGICNISLSELLIKEVGYKNDSSLSILESINQGELVNDKYVTKVLEDRLSASDAMINGWILSGYPKTSSQIQHIKSSKLLNPTKVIFLYLDDEVIGKRSEQRRLDPLTGKIYFLDQIDKNKFPKDILTRLTIKNEDKPSNFSKEISKEIEEVFQPKLERISDTSVLTIVDKISNYLESDSS